MHIREFRERIEGIEEHEELCSSFRVMIGNQFEFYLSRKEMDCEERTLVFVDIDRIQKENQIEEEWSIIPEECILKICNELDVPYNRSSELCYDDNGDSYIKAVICDLWNIISKLDSTRFMLAIIDLIQLLINILKNTLRAQQKNGWFRMVFRILLRRKPLWQCGLVIL